MSEDVNTTLDSDRQKLARQYARTRRRLWLVRLLLSGLYVGLWLGFGWADLVSNALDDMLLPGWIHLLLISTAFAAPRFVISLPLSYYSSFILPHRYELSNQTIRGWWVDLVKGSLISLVIGAPLLVMLYRLIEEAPRSWWLWASGAYTIVGAVLTAVAPVLLMPIFFKFKPLGDEHEALAIRLVQLAEKAKTHVRGVFTFDMSRRTKAANAALVGLGRTRRIILGDTLLDEFSSDEIETVLAHELAHHVHKDIPLSLLAQTFGNLLTFFLTHRVLVWAGPRLGLTGPADPVGLPLLAFVFGATGVLIMPFANAFSRWRESMADDYALSLTGKAGPFASAMTRLANQNLAEADPDPWVVILLHSHPPLKRRIEKAHSLQGSLS